MSLRISTYTRGLRQSTSGDNFPACEARPRRGMRSARPDAQIRHKTRRVFVPFVIFLSYVVILAAS